MSASVCPVVRTVRGVSVVDGAGVRLNRIIGSPRLGDVDPFVLLDEFRSNDPRDYIAGFPEHPHRGIETITYMIEGRFRHRDSRGGGGIMEPGCVQWMTAGRGIVHSEMPDMREGSLWGYQLWLNLAARDKMVEPRYQGLEPQDIPVVEEKGLRITLIAGSYGGARGPARTWYPVSYFDVRLAGGAKFGCPRPQGSCFVYVHTGSVSGVPAGELALLGEGDEVALENGASAAAGLLFIAGVPHREPIVRGGPFVMNTEQEIRQAFRDYQAGTLF